MSQYTVDWNLAATAGIAGIWTASRFRSALTEAQHRIDQLLAADPRNNGEEHSEGLYRVAVWPLIVMYEIDDTAGRVIVTAVGVVN